MHIFAHWQIPKYTHLKIQKYGNYEYLATIFLGFIWTKVFNGYLFTKFLSVFVKFTSKKQGFCSYNEKKIIRQSKWKFPKFIFSKISSFHPSVRDLRIYFITKVIAWNNTFVFYFFPSKMVVLWLFRSKIQKSKISVFLYFSNISWLRLTILSKNEILALSEYEKGWYSVLLSKFYLYHMIGWLYSSYILDRVMSVYLMHWLVSDKVYLRQSCKPNITNNISKTFLTYNSWIVLKFFLK